MAFGLYVHFPFCTNHCSYCDFYKEIHDKKLERDFYRALTVETELVASQQTLIDDHIATVYIGGGTPSLTNMKYFEKWLNKVREVFTFDNTTEFTLECNPETIDLEKLAALKELGINRPVFGIQSFNIELLKILSRKHKPYSSHRAIYLANALGYRNYGVDIIFGLPRQTSKMLSADLDQVIDLNPPHISFYQLTVEPGTALDRKINWGKLKLPDTELVASMYRGGVNRLTEVGYNRYEVSSFAREGFECRHNLGYWEGADYIGLGPSAHSFMFSQRFYNVPDVHEYITCLTEDKRRPLIKDDSDDDARMTEAIMLGLRTSRGIDCHQFASRFGVTVEERLDPVQLQMLLESGHVETRESTIRLTDEGINLADEITSRLVK